ncbi:hypothetical protein [Hyalangium gracile]|uniref:hypothetical protein n=1 Tax=Hyalangium gracile TaxID=394092 RepID=UPI001CCD7639|nr:hypothetical protein [Hyalangium gracile]
MLPGTLLTRDAATEVLKRIEAELGQSTAYDWQPVSVDTALAWIERLPSEEFYLYYQHPVHDFMDRCSRVEKDTALRFVEERFALEQGEGVDLYLTPLNFSTVFAGNHDGRLFRAK